MHGLCKGHHRRLFLPVQEEGLADQVLDSGQAVDVLTARQRHGTTALRRIVPPGRVGAPDVLAQVVLVPRSGVVSTATW